MHISLEYVTNCRVSREFVFRSIQIDHYFIDSIMYHDTLFDGPGFCAQRPGMDEMDQQRLLTEEQQSNDSRAMIIAAEDRTWLQIELFDSIHHQSKSLPLKQIIIIMI